MSPFDLIPDFIPILGYLDDLIVAPLGISVALKLVPEDVIADCRARASAASGRPTSWIGAAFMTGVWLVGAGWAVLLVKNMLDT